MKRMLASLLMFSALLLGACTEPNVEKPATSGDDIRLSRESLSLTADAATESIGIEASGDWGVTSKDTSWCTVTPSGGVAGVSTVKVTVSENKSGDVRRTNIVFRTTKGEKIMPVEQNYKIEAVQIADPALRKALLEQFDTDGDGILSTKEVANITRLELAGKGIESMAELNGLFRGVTYLDCSNNRLTELDITKLTKLTYLDCSGNRLTTLDIRNQQSLTAFDATSNPDLKTIYVWTGFKAGAGFKKPDSAEWVEPEIPTPAGYRLVWQDEFNDAGETLPSTAKWWYETGDNGWGNNELQDYVSGRYGDEKLALVSNGTLKIIAKKIGGKVRSIRMNTVEGWTYGYFEARLKLPAGKGTWPAFWMMPKNFKTWPGDGEIDIMEEVGYNPNRCSSSIHCNAYNHSIGTQKTNEILIATAQTEFHTYAVEWTESYLKFYFDGKLHFTFTNDRKGDYNTWPFYNPFYLKLNLAWGGNWGGAQGIDENCLPAVYEIDYVRVFKKIE